MEKESNPNKEWEFKISTAEISGNAPKIDLHGLKPDEAAKEVDIQINQAFMNGDPAVMIIHGRGTGALRKVVHEALSQHELVEYFRDGTHPGEIGGVTYAVIAEKD